GSGEGKIEGDRCRCGGREVEGVGPAEEEDFGEGVGTLNGTSVEDIGVITRAAGQRVIARAAVQSVGASAAVESIATAVPGEDVVGVVTGDSVDTAAADDVLHGSRAGEGEIDGVHGL